MAISAPVGGTTLIVGTAATTYNVAYPTSPAAGDLLVLQISLNTTSALSVPSGWTQIANLTASGTTTPRIALFITVATGTESGTLAVTVPSTIGQARIWKISGVDTATPQDVTATTVSLAATTAYTVPSLTTVTAGAMLFGFVGANISGAGTFTPPTNGGTWTEIHDDNTQMHASTAYRITTTAGSTGSANFLRSGSIRGAGVLAAFRPYVPGVVPRNVRSYNPALNRSYNW